ncbi:MAG: hypothetical protein EHM42_02235 [Planctomycetaceae bacterium]|nr:MAG: hypothetical protein EHM42_02235 [Planctomycetaceae bacterium]
MNCDEAFELLTDAAAGSETDLARHLAACPRCRQMCEVLAPAIALFAPPGREANESRPARRRPMNWSELAATEAAISAANLCQTPSGKYAPLWRRAAPWLRTAALVALGATATLAWTTVRAQRPDQNRGAGRDAAICSRPLAARIVNAGGATPQAIQLAASCVACHHPSNAAVNPE